jgi:predicted GIY-YIG superfamily endonuclease
LLKAKAQMFYVYLIRSIAFPDQVYVGITEDLKKRLVTHNSGGSVHTAKYKPWKLIVYLGFKNEAKARQFEKYLKSGSGRAFAKKRLW